MSQYHYFYPANKTIYRLSVLKDSEGMHCLRHEVMFDKNGVWYLFANHRRSSYFEIMKELSEKIKLFTRIGYFPIELENVPKGEEYGEVYNPNV